MTKPTCVFKSILLSLLFCTRVTLVSAITLFTADPVISDSLLTKDHIYEFTFSNPEKAERIIELMRVRKLADTFILDVAQGDLYFNNGKYRKALVYYEQALESDSVRNNDIEYMEQLHRMISCYDCLHDEVRKGNYVNLLLKKSETCGNKEMKSVALFNMGKMIYYQEDKEKGYHLIKEAVSLMKKSAYKYKYDNLRYNYNTLLIMQQRDKRYEDALKTLDELQEVITEETQQESPIENLDKKEKKTLYAQRAVVLLRLGKTVEADAAYRQWESIGEFYSKDDYLIIPYLMDKKMFDKVINMYTSREKFLRDHNDTINYHMKMIKHALGNAYEGKGNYKKAARYFKELGILLDSLKAREQQSTAMEMANVYETHEKDLLIHRQVSDIRMRNVMLGFGSGIICLLGILLWRIIRYNRLIHHKNDAMVQTIGDLLISRENLYRKREENFALQEQLKSNGKSLETKIGFPDKENVGCGKSEVIGKVNMLQIQETHEKTEIQEDFIKASLLYDEKPNDNEWYDKGLFERMEHEIISRQLFLKTDFSREELIKIVYIPKNKFASLFKQYAGVNFPKYINNLRLEHAAKMLKECPAYTVDYIAKACGMNTVQTFHRLFLNKFGVTPAEFRAGLKRAGNEIDKDSK